MPVHLPIFRGYDPSKLKPQLKMAVTRFSIAANKKSALSKQVTREIAKMLGETPPREEKARIKAEALIRDDDTIEAYEILQLTCDLLFERIRLMSHASACPPDLVESVSTLMWASVVVDIPELVEIRKQFRHKYGRDFEEDAMRNAGGVVNERVASKLSVQPPSAYDVQVYLEKIADEHGVEWKPRVPLRVEEMCEPTKAPTGVNEKGSSGSIVPSAPPMPPVPHPIEYDRVLPRPYQPNDRMIPDDIDEDDIFVPGSSSQSDVPPRGGGRDEGGDGEGGEGDGAGGNQSAGERSGDSGGAGGGGDSLDDLAARFAILQRFSTRAFSLDAEFA